MAKYPIDTCWTISRDSFDKFLIRVMSHNLCVILESLFHLDPVKSNRQGERVLSDDYHLVLYKLFKEGLLVEWVECFSTGLIMVFS